MKRLFILAMILLAFGVAAAASGPEAERFIDGMLEGVGARRVACPPGVTQDTEARSMQAVCASYDGDFESFESRWAKHVRDDLFDGSGRLPQTRAQTAWEYRSGNYERVYVVGRAIIGVRFSRGTLLLVY